jgi:zinc/manganese transport system substrate-binding protein
MTPNLPWDKSTATRRRALMLGSLASVALQPARGWAADPAIVASFSILADLVRQVGGSLVNVASLVPPDADVHVYQPDAANSRTLTAADMLVENGLGLEGWMARLAEASDFRGVRVVTSKGVAPRLMREGDATSLDPHAWQNPRNGITYVENIAAGLVAADPGHADTWRRNAAGFIAKIEQTDAWIAAQYTAIPEAARRIVTTHDAFGYYGDRYGVSFLAAEGISTDAEPSAKGIAALVRQVKQERVHMVFLENMTDSRITRTLAQETGAIVSGPLYSDALSKSDGPAPDYLTMLRYNTELFVRAMRAG